MESGLTTAEAEAALAAGRPVIVTGAREGAFMLVSAEGATPEVINLMATHARGLVGMILSKRRAAALGLDLQPRQGRAEAPLYTMSIEAARGTTTGISAADRARTIRAAAFGGAEDIVSPGHIFPQVPDGRDAGQAALALRLIAGAGTAPVAALCTILDAAGEVAGPAAAWALAARLGLVAVDAGEIRQPSGSEYFS